MSNEELKQLETLLEKLHTVIGRYCVIPCYLQGGFCVGTYNSEGDINRQTVGPTLEDVLNKILNNQK